MYLVNTTEYLRKRLGPKLFYGWRFDAANLRALRAARLVAENYWRAMIPEVHFGNDLAHAIEHFEIEVAGSWRCCSVIFPLDGCLSSSRQLLMDLVLSHTPGRFDLI